jgi:hypothetical protein
VKDEVTDDDFLKAKAFLSGSSAWQIMKAGIQAQIAMNWRKTFGSIDERELNRIIGGNETLTAFIDDVDSATGQMVAKAKAGQAASIQLDGQ